MVDVDSPSESDHYKLACTDYLSVKPGAQG